MLDKRINKIYITNQVRGTGETENSKQQTKGNENDSKKNKPMGKKLSELR